MDLTTRCPKCGTVFEASLQDLQLRKGYIRCVQCAHIFDGYAEVVAEAQLPDDEDDRAPSGAAGIRPAGIPVPQVFRSARPAAPGVQVPGFHVTDNGRPEGRPAHPGPHIGPGELSREPVIGGLESTSVLPQSQAEPFVVEARPGRRSQGGTAEPLLHAASDSRGVLARAGRLIQHLLLWLLLLLLAAQGLYVYRSQLALAVPALRPWLVQACGYLHCQVPYARDIARIAITGSSLKAADAAPTPDAGSATQHFILNVTLRNASEQPQEWPMLMLDLKDAAGAQLVRRNLAPADYLGAATAEQPFAARSEVLLRVPMTLSGVRINGYQLDLFFP